jgi:hypothetical protein
VNKAASIWAAPRQSPRAQPLSDPRSIGGTLDQRRDRMSFQAYIDNIQAKTGTGPEEFKRLAEQKGFLKKGVLTRDTKAGDIVAWLKQDFGLGHGHAMAIYALFKGKKS